MPRSLLLPFAILLASTFLAEAAADYAGKDLQGKDFKNENFNNANFEGANLQRAVLTNATCRNANFRDADLQGAGLKQAIFDGADLTGAKLQRADLGDAKFRSAKLPGAEIHLARATIIDTSKFDFRVQRTLDEAQDRTSGALSFQSADLRNARILGNAEGVDFRGADLRGADLSQTENLDHARFKGAKYDEHTRWNKVDPAELKAVFAGAEKAEERVQPAAEMSKHPLIGTWYIMKELGAKDTGSLKIRPDKTYEWNPSLSVADSESLQGTWSEDGERIVLTKGELGKHWTVTAKGQSEIRLESGGEARAAVKSDK